MNLLEFGARVLVSHNIPHAVIGATAMAVHGVSRATADIDILAWGRLCLEPKTWDALANVNIDIREGDDDDPLLGVVRLGREAEVSIDVIIAKHIWQQQVLERAAPAMIAGVNLPVVNLADLILLKLYAGGPQDAWDIHQLLAGEDINALRAEVERTISVLPQDSQRLWERISAQDLTR